MRTILKFCAPLVITAALLVGFSPTFSLLLRAQGYSAGNQYYWVPPGACGTGVSGNGTGTQQLTTVGASFAPVIQAQTSASGTNTHTFTCNIAPPSYLVTTGSGLMITDATFYYGVQTTGLGTQAAVLASGTMNGVIVFSYVDMPTAGTSETPSTVTPVRADSGTLAISPAVASFNVATTTAGAFYSAKFTPASGTLVHKTVNRALWMVVSLLNTATSATITNSPGILVHYRSQAS